MDEGGGLENRYTGDCIVGSNPTPSANDQLPLPSVAVRTVLFSHFSSYIFVEQGCPLEYCAIRRRLLQSM